MCISIAAATCRKILLFVLFAGFVMSSANALAGAGAGDAAAGAGRSTAAEPSRSKGVPAVGAAQQVPKPVQVGDHGDDRALADDETVPDRTSGAGRDAQPAPSKSRGQSETKQGNVQQSVSDGAPLPAPRVDFVKTAVDAVAPMDPTQIRDFRKKLNERQAAEVAPITSDLIPVSVTYDVDLSPGAKPQVIQITPGQGALVNIIDREGNGWPIEFVKNYNEGALKAEQMGASTLSLEALSNHQIASVGVLLQGMSVAWSFTVIPAQVTTDVRVDLRVSALSPGAVSKVGRASGLPSIGTKLDGYLYGGTPDGARRLEVEGVAGARAWQSPTGRLVLRISGLVSSPAWYERMPAADGTAVYELPATPIVAVATEDGVSHTLRIKGLQPSVSAAGNATRASR